MTEQDYHLIQVDGISFFSFHFDFIFSPMACSVFPGIKWSLKKKKKNLKTYLIKQNFKPNFWKPDGREMQEAKAIQQQAPQKNQIMFLETGAGDVTAKTIFSVFN